MQTDFSASARANAVLLGGDEYYLEEAVLCEPQDRRDSWGDHLGLATPFALVTSSVAPSHAAVCLAKAAAPDEAVPLFYFAIEDRLFVIRAGASMDADANTGEGYALVMAGQGRVTQLELPWVLTEAGLFDVSDGPRESLVRPQPGDALVRMPDGALYVGSWAPGAVAHLLPVAAYAHAGYEEGKKRFEAAQSLTR